MRSLPLLSLCGLVGCATINYGTPPSPPAGEHCAFPKTLTLVSASARVEVIDDSGFSMQPNVGAAPTFRLTGPSRSHTSSASGLSFFLGDSRLAPRAALERLQQPDLVATYDAELARFARGGIHRWARPLWVTLIAGALVAMGAGLGLMFNAQATRPKGGRADYGPSTAALLVGAGALVVMLPFVVLDLSNREYEAPFLAREAFLVADGPALEAVQRAVTAHNERETAACTPR
ncbi:MAG: hypothetical protein GQE15_40295 [Archangiaceae bacterium]|nr:hypothetical protein [Archangiaceae bacterium]